MVSEMLIGAHLRLKDRAEALRKSFGRQLIYKNLMAMQGRIMYTAVTDFLRRAGSHPWWMRQGPAAEGLVSSVCF